MKKILLILLMGVSTTSVFSQGPVSTVIYAGGTVVGLGTGTSAALIAWLACKSITLGQDNGACTKLAAVVGVGAGSYTKGYIDGVGSIVETAGG